jgi:tight adherence protein C
MALTELIAILAFVGILVFIIAFYFLFRERKEHGKLLERLAEPGQAVEFNEEIVTANSGIKAYFLTVLRSLSPIARPKNEEQVSYLRKKFLKAGLRGDYALIFFWGAKVFAALVLLALVILVNLLFIRESSSIRLFMVEAILSALIGFYLPDLWLRIRIGKRREAIFKGLPDALDMLVVCVEAGMGLDAALSRVGEEMQLTHKVLSDELNHVTLELRAGKHRQEALRNLAQRTDLEDLASLVSLLIQTDKFGTSISQSLRVYSDTMRTKRFQRAEEIAAKIGVKMSFPLILFIFPSLFVVILGPALVIVYRLFMSH